MSDLEELLRHPVAWVAGAAGSVAGVVASILGDPIGGVLAIVDVANAYAFNIFTASSIAGFTLGPALPQVPAGFFQAIALGAGALIVIKVSDSLWDAIKQQLRRED